MRHLCTVALLLTVATASCSGGRSGSVVPASPGQPASAARTARTAAAVPAGWAATSTLASNLLNATDKGVWSGEHWITVRLGLPLRNVSQLKAAVAAQTRLTPSQFAATYAPTAADVQAVTSYLTAQGFKSIVVEPNNLIVTATGTVPAIDTAFHTSLHQYTIHGETVYANATPAYVPQSLAGKVVAVLGLSSVRAFSTEPHIKRGAAAPVARTASTTAASPCSLYGLEILAFPEPVQEPQSPAGCLRNYAPSDYWIAYDANRMATAYSVDV